MTVYNAIPLQGLAPWIAGEQVVSAFYFPLSAGLASGDTIVLPQAIPPAGVLVTSVLVYHPPLDSNVTPTGTYDFGDNQTDGNEEARFMLDAPMGGAGAQIHNFTNVAPAFTGNVQNVGNGYLYQQDQSTAGTVNGYWNAVLTVTASPATAVTSGCMYFYINYNCVGLLS